MRVTLNFIGTLYGLFGLMSVLTFWMYLRYGPSLKVMDIESSQMYFGLLGICMTNAIIGALIFFSFWSLKPWGRYLAIGFNVVWISTMTVGAFIGRVTDSRMLLFDGVVLVFIGVFLLPPVAITWFLLRPEVKMFMEKD